MDYLLVEISLSQIYSQGKIVDCRKRLKNSLISFFLTLLTSAEFLLIYSLLLRKQKQVSSS